jgi:hypothetical protein
MYPPGDYCEREKGTSGVAEVLNTSPAETLRAPRSRPRELRQEVPRRSRRGAWGSCRLCEKQFARRRDDLETF